MSRSPTDPLRPFFTVHSAQNSTIMTSNVDGNRRRLTLCKAPLFPGSPSDYRYQPERCILLPKKKRSSTRKAVTTQRAIDLAELAAIGNVTGAWVSVPLKLPADPSILGDVVQDLEAKDTSIIQTFRKMISHSLRVRFKDPLKRMAFVQQSDKFLGPKMKLNVRYRVFLLMEAHLVEVMATAAARR